MKALFGLLAVVFVIVSCDKKEDHNTDVLSNEDLIASQNIGTELVSIQQALDNLIAATNNTDRIYWDNLYHHHDSLFWHHHNIYHHSTYSHDDHSHQWVAYDPSINHHHHYHHPYPGHLNDSLVVTTNNHHHTDCHHHPGHHICHHHTMDSLHQLHNLHHP